MKRPIVPWIIGIVVVVGAVAAGALYRMPHTASTHAATAALATPPGITLQPLGSAQGYSAKSGQIRLITLSREEGIAYSDANGMTLYTYDKDEPSKSNCAADCAKAWPPAAALPNAQPYGDWSVVAREDGTKQWAFKGRPLYRYAMDVDIGSRAGLSPRPTVSADSIVQKRQTVTVPPDWHLALVYPVTSITLPYGLGIGEVADANGLVLLDARDMTLYTFNGDPNQDKPVCAVSPCAAGWTPLAAPQLADSTGDFSFVLRKDGIKQWAYKGKPLYTFDGDFAPSDAYGIGIDKRWQAAQLVRYFMPPDVTMRQTAGLGTVLATTDGKTLYRRDAFAYQSGGGHSLRHGIPIRPAVGRDIGTKSCDAACLKTWHPFKAAADAQPSGYWDLATLDDGSKQWVYQGYALYTFEGDTKPGDMNGNDTYDLALNDDPNKISDAPTPMPGMHALYWTAATP